jgi:poly-gamma-glutamate capsule biosynthesis protein CapA/YwtB (metallophosphatase superfamily)
VSISSRPNRTLRLAAVGDLLLTSTDSGASEMRDHRLFADDVRQLFADCDLVFGNLECTLAGDGRTIPTEPRVVANEQHIRGLRTAGLSLVTVANNHTFDCVETGYAKLRGVLNEIGLPHFGAGMDLNEATAPLFMECNGLRIAFMAAVDQRSSPYRFAAVDQWGVAGISIDRMVAQIQSLRLQADHVVVSLHWGEERFLIPAPEQIEQAHALVDAGASLVLGHHPHVIQGVERRRDAAIIYSLGNFIADPVYFCNGDVMNWNRVERTGCIALADFSEGELTKISYIPTYDDGKLVRLDRSGIGQRRIDKATRAVAGGVALPRYRRHFFWVKVVRPAIAKLRWSELMKLRLRHVRRLVELVFHGRRAK